MPEQQWPNNRQWVSKADYTKYWRLSKGVTLKVRVPILTLYAIYEKHPDVADMLDEPTHAALIRIKENGGHYVNYVNPDNPLSN